MSLWGKRVEEEMEATFPLMQKLCAAAERGGHHDLVAINEAIQWTAIQLDPEADDYETWEATLLARLEDTDRKGER